MVLYSVGILIARSIERRPGRRNRAAGRIPKIICESENVLEYRSQLEKNIYALISMKVLKN